MNFPRYKFSIKVQPELMEFLKVAEEQKSQETCNFEHHKLWQQILPQNPTLIPEQNSNRITSHTTINVCSVKEVEELTVHQNQETEAQIEENCEKNGISDIAFTIKENLETLNDLSVNVKKQINTCSDSSLEDLFHLLQKRLNDEEVFYLGKSLQNLSNNVLILGIFCRHLLVSRIVKQYNDDFSSLLEQLSLNFPSILREELQEKVPNFSAEEIKVFLQYQRKFSIIYQITIFKDFLGKVKKLNENHLIFIEHLISDQVEYEILNKLTELLSISADDFTENKIFGKVLMQTIQNLGSNVMLLEQPLKHLVSSHKTVWKSKLEKTLKTSIENSQIMSQSFLYTQF